MTDVTAEEYFPHDTFHKEWTVFWVFAVVSGFLFWSSFFRPAPLPAPPQMARSIGMDWFLVLHMPEVPRDPAKTARARAQFGQWLDALARGGYHPLLLSDVERRLHDGVGLPDRSVVLVFDPGYDHTFQTLAPVLQTFRFPALWMTDRTALLRGDRHFVHSRQARWMIRSGYWDVGYTGDGFWGRVNPDDARKMWINGLSEAQWAPGTGRAALNWSGSWEDLHRLDVSPKWTADDFIERLAMELPLYKPVRLSARNIQHYLWGIAMDSSSHADSRFAFQPHLSMTSRSLYWLGTRGVNDLRLRMDVPAFFGQLFFWLRSDPDTGSGIGVGFSKDQIFVDQMDSEGVRRRLQMFPRHPAGNSIQATITLVGDTLDLQEDGSPALHIALAPEEISGKSRVRMTVYDRIRGAASVDVKEIVLTPLSAPRRPD